LAVACTAAGGQEVQAPTDPAPASETPSWAFPSAYCPPCLGCGEHSELVAALDEDGDGRTELTYRYRYGPDGQCRSAEMEADEDGDGEADERSRFDYEEGRLVVSRYGPDASTGFVLEVWRFEYAAGVLVGSTLDRGGDGSVERRCAYEPPCPPPARDCVPVCQETGAVEPPP
jgi:hypothetical protein